MNLPSKGISEHDLSIAVRQRAAQSSAIRRFRERVRRGARDRRGPHRYAATVLSDGDAGLWKLQRQVMPEATLVLDWWHIAMRFEHARQAARGLGADTPAGHLRGYAVRDLEGAKWLLRHGRSSSCLTKLACWFGAPHVRNTHGALTSEKYIRELIQYLRANRCALVNYGCRRHARLPISTAFVESRSTRSCQSA